MSWANGRFETRGVLWGSTAGLEDHTQEQFRCFKRNPRIARRSVTLILRLVIDAKPAIRR